uniref:HDC14831 n=1 Tax=Drosophila melanogaster TaxID=7227 RepID=Q6IJJ3_DROME|nr:TPA_inf: HDC14831 [Drosophila melanogaster]
MSQYFSIMRNAYNLLLFAPHSQRAHRSRPTKQQIAASRWPRVQGAGPKISDRVGGSGDSGIRGHGNRTNNSIVDSNQLSGCTRRCWHRDPPDWEVSSLPRSHSVFILVEIVRRMQRFTLLDADYHFGAKIKSLCGHTACRRRNAPEGQLKPHPDRIGSGRVGADISEFECDLLVGQCATMACVFNTCANLIKTTDQVPPPAQQPSSSPSH